MPSTVVPGDPASRFADHIIQLRIESKMESDRGVMLMIMGDQSGDKTLLDALLGQNPFIL